MSGLALYKVLVRMLYDPRLVSEVYANGERALQGVEITPAERSWLVRSDRRAWGTDPLRRSRSLAGLMEEFPASCAFILRRGREGAVRPETNLLDAFFGSGVFHASVQEGTSLVFAFGDYLQQDAHAGVAADPRGAVLAVIESAIARVRRTGAGGSATGGGRDAGHRDPDAPVAVGPTAGTASDSSVERDPMLILSRNAEILPLPTGAYELHSRITRTLKATKRKSIEVLLHPQWSLPVLLDLDPSEIEHVLVEGTTSSENQPDEDDRTFTFPGGLDRRGATVTTVTPELGGLLLAARRSRSQSFLLAEARRLGAEPGEEAGVIASLIAEGLLGAALLEAAPHTV
jgi:hypothetical protein